MHLGCLCLLLGRHLDASSELSDQFAHLLHGVEQSNPAPSVEIVWLQHPNIGVGKHALPQRVLLVRFRLGGQIGVRQQGLVDLGKSLRLVLFNGVEIQHEPVDLLVHLRAVLIVDNERHWQTIKCVLEEGFARLLHALEDLVFLSDAPVVFKVVHQVFLAVLAQELKFDEAAHRTPFEVKERDVGRYLLPAVLPRSGLQTLLDHLVVVAFQQNVSVGPDVALLFLVPSNICVLALDLLFLLDQFHVELLEVGSVVVHKPIGLSLLLVHKLGLLVRFVYALLALSHLPVPLEAAKFLVCVLLIEIFLFGQFDSLLFFGLDRGLRCVFCSFRGHRLQRFGLHWSS